MNIEVFSDRDRPNLTDNEIKADILLQAFAWGGSLPVGPFTPRQTRLMEELFREGALVKGPDSYSLSDKMKRQMEQPSA